MFTIMRGSPPCKIPPGLLTLNQEPVDGVCLGGPPSVCLFAAQQLARVLHHHLSQVRQHLGQGSADGGGLAPIAATYAQEKGPACLPFLWGEKV
jgi:hypothetical protein